METKCHRKLFQNTFYFGIFGLKQAIFLFKRLCTFMQRNHKIASCPLIHVNVYIYIPLQIWHYYKNSLRKCVVHFDRNFGCYPYTYETDMGLDIFCSSHYLYFWLDIYLRVIAHDLSSLSCLTKHLFQSIFLQFSLLFYSFVDYSCRYFTIQDLYL